MAYREELKKIPYQEIADSPTVKYYTDWRIYEKKLDLENAETYDEVNLDLATKYDCIILADNSMRLIGSCKSEDLDVEPKECILGPRKEKMLMYHAMRTDLKKRIEVNGGKTLLVLRGGKGYVGHTIDIEVHGKTRIDVLDIALSEGLRTSVIRLNLHKDSEAEVNQLSYHSEKNAVYQYYIVGQNENSKLSYKLAAYAGEMSRLRVDADLLGEKASIETIVGALARGNTRGDYIINVVHEKPETQSRIDSRGVSLDNSLLAIRGIARVSGDAWWSSSHVEAHVTVLGDKAKGYAVPMLEIFTGNVKEAYHSASVTNIRGEELFYLKSRGFNMEDIERLLTHGILERTQVTRVFRNIIGVPQ
jgi:Fe-S cluster assembly scaffold protein SufB